MMVMMTAITPSLNASILLLLMAAKAYPTP